MDLEQVVRKVTEIFRNEFSDPELIITNDLTASDIDGWDSLTHMLLVSALESSFNVKFKLKELNKMRNVGDLINFILAKT